ncbi:MAG: pyruvate dehydrogenase complex dihydrolipoamide acetyltransferase [Rhodothermales bacterium]|nr:pyruvate dehydrogenase complex dihydrolipoamide acetyltransferase [Rhodothermales bacterium]
MAIAVEMPKMSDTMEEGVLVAWLAEEGDAVSAGDVIAQVETDKATMDLEVYDDGVLLKKVVEEGAGVPIGGLIAVLGAEGEDVSDVLAKYEGGGDGAAADGAAAESDASETSTASEPAPPEPAREEQAQAASQPAGDGAPQKVPEGYGHEGQRPEPTPVAAPATSGDGAGRVKASPLARRMAQEGGLDLAQLRGSGPDGRIVKRDVEAALEGRAPSRAPTQAPAAPAERAPERPAAPRPQPAPSLPQEASEAVPITQMRKTIARRLAASKFTAPHFYLTVEIDMERAVAVRKELNELAAAQDRPKVSFNDLVTKACALALRRHPQVNSSYLEDEGVIRRHNVVHVAVAVAVDEGLLTPVVRHADQKGLAQISEETRAYAERARNRELQPQDWEGSTFTTSNLGMFGIGEFTAIINPPNACILAIGAIRDVPVVKNGAVVPGKRMAVTLSCDHRVVDGATGAQFLADVKAYLEEPMNLLL